MNRFTQRMPGTNSCGITVPVKFALDFVFNMPDHDFLQFQAMLDRLAEYEDTGLTPAEIMAQRAELEQIYTALA